MAVLQGNNSEEVLCGESVVAASFTWSDLRVDVGLVPVRRSAGEMFWLLVADAVLRYKAYSPVARWLIPRLSALAAVVVYWIVRLMPYWLSR